MVVTRQTLKRQFIRTLLESSQYLLNITSEDDRNSQTANDYADTQSVLPNRKFNDLNELIEYMKSLGVKPVPKRNHKPLAFDVHYPDVYYIAHDLGGVDIKLFPHGMSVQEKKTIFDSLNEKYT